MNSVAISTIPAPPIRAENEQRAREQQAVPHQAKIQRRLDSLPLDWSLPAADIYAIYPERLNLSAKVRIFVEFMERYLARELNRDSAG
ncbi:hypothetical protein [Pandoraea sp. NPDC087047]|uniref:hypothetical protein n=1 Tax=Pandoraea sp. NPDC087047 TaxID=3364390 RepID=UPI00381C4F41